MALLWSYSVAVTRKGRERLRSHPRANTNIPNRSRSKIEKKIYRVDISVYTFFQRVFFCGDIPKLFFPKLRVESK